MTFNFPRSEPKKKMTAIRLTEEQHEFLTEVAGYKGLSLPETINVFIQAAIEAYGSAIKE